MKQPRAFSTNDPSYFVAASTSGSARPIALTPSNASAGVCVGGLRFIDAQYSRLRDAIQADRHHRHETGRVPANTTAYERNRPPPFAVPVAAESTSSAAKREHRHRRGCSALRAAEVVRVRILVVCRHERPLTPTAAASSRQAAIKRRPTPLCSWRVERRCRRD
jgi:hypothetical protein